MLRVLENTRLLLLYFFFNNKKNCDISIYLKYFVIRITILKRLQKDYSQSFNALFSALDSCYVFHAYVRSKNAMYKLINHNHMKLHKAEQKIKYAYIFFYRRQLTSLQDFPLQQ